MLIPQLREPLHTLRRKESIVWRGLASTALLSTMVLALTSSASAAPSSKGWSEAVQIGSKDASSGQVSYSVSCPTSTFCVSVNGDGQVLYDRSGVWSSPNPLMLGGSIDSVSCSSINFCVAVASGRAAAYGGESWKSTPRMGPAEDDYQVSCPTSTFCAAVGANGVPGKPSALVTFNGRSWTDYKTAASSSSNDRLLSVSCVTAGFCIATNVDGQILAFNGSQWIANRSSGTKGLISVSCASSRFCMAVTISGESTTFDGKDWTRATPIPSFANGLAYAVSCASPSECSVIGLSGSVTTWKLGRWSTPQRVFSRESAGVAISCSKGDNCVAVTDRGLSAHR
jgi:hypothetical protein